MSETITPGAALLVLPTAGLPTILAADDKDILGNLLKELEGWEPDISTDKGRKEIASKAQKVRVAKADFGRLADRLKEDAIKTQRAVNAEVKILTERMDALIERVRGPLTEFENKEKQRIADHEAALAAIAESEGYGRTETAAELQQRLDYLGAYPARDWEEFKDRATKVMLAEIDRTIRLLAAAEKREAEAAELERLRTEEAERKRLADIEAQRLREERIAAEAAERAKAEAEAKAAREAKQAEERAQAALRDQALAAERQKAEALRKEREAAEALARAEREKQEAIDRAEAARIAAEQKAERERLAAIERERLAIENAEAARAAAARKAESDRLAAIEAERQRVAREAAAQKAEDDRRAANKAHRASIDRDVVTDLVLAMSDDHSGDADEASKIARAIVIALASNKVRHTAINYAAPATKGPLL